MRSWRGFAPSIRADDAAFLHLVHDAGRTGIAELQPALQERNGGLPRLQNNVDRRWEQLVALAGVLRGCAAVGLAALLGAPFDLLHDLGGVVALRLGLDRIHDGLHLFIRDEAALHALRLALSERSKEHIALADELFRARRVENDARFHGGRDRKGNARRDIGLHQAGDDVRGRTLGGNDEVDAGGAAHLRDTADRPPRPPWRPRA